MPTRYNATLNVRNGSTADLRDGWKADLSLVQALPPFSIAGCFDQAPVQVRSSVVPPRRTALAQADLGRVHPCSSTSQLVAALGRANSTSRTHKLLREPCSHFGVEAGVRRPPETRPQAADHDGVPAVRRVRSGRALAHSEGGPASRQRSEQYFTCSQSRAHFLRQANGRSQVTQSFSAKCSFLCAIGLKRTDDLLGQCDRQTAAQVGKRGALLCSAANWKRPKATGLL